MLMNDWVMLMGIGYFSSCFICFCILIIYDGFMKRKINVISSLYGMWLIWCMSYLLIFAVFADECKTSSWIRMESCYAIAGGIRSIGSDLYASIGILFIVMTKKCSYNSMQIIKFCVISNIGATSAAFMLSDTSEQFLHWMDVCYIFCAALFVLGVWVLNYRNWKTLYVFKEINNPQISKVLLMGLISVTWTICKSIFVDGDLNANTNNISETIWLVSQVMETIFYMPFVIPMFIQVNRMKCFSIKKTKHI